MLATPFLLSQIQTLIPRLYPKIPHLEKELVSTPECGTLILKDFFFYICFRCLIVVALDSARLCTYLAISR